MSGVLNVKVIKQKNVDLRLKLDTWRKRMEERKRLKKRTYEHGKKLREVFIKFSHDFTIEKDKVLDCIIHYNQYCEDKTSFEIQEKVVNDFLCMLPESAQILEIKDLERVLDNEQKNFKQESNIMRDFAQVVRSECVLNSYYFSFYDIPDLIVKKKYPRKDYDLIVKLLNKVKKKYLV